MKIQQLVYFEEFLDKSKAVKHEQQLKKWKRQWKIDLINKSNPDWKDLYDTFSKKPSALEIIDLLFGEKK